MLIGKGIMRHAGSHQLTMYSLEAIESPGHVSINMLYLDCVMKPSTGFPQYYSWSSLASYSALRLELFVISCLYCLLR